MEKTNLALTLYSTKKGNEELGEPNRWCVEIETLDELHDLIREINTPIIMKKGHSIELYDDYRE